MDWNAALSSLSTALTVTKAIKDIDSAYDKAVYKGQIAELLSSLADVKISVLEAQDELREKDAEIARLNASSRLPKLNCLKVRETTGGSTKAMALNAAFPSARRAMTKRDATLR